MYFAWIKTKNTTIVKWFNFECESDVWIVASKYGHVEYIGYTDEP